ncbi:MAG: hypothetical protein OXF83_08705 [Anaerolineaceae bacterium]|nr:hypothetical protein [Anaerolineaceae bacterium]MCY3935051.1 hypothetical protein [Chloroflexota bacterium]MCY4008396.1 hypothetical protein [Anaerolineaceae bacterium]MCY4105226.1 hypothetical protein [Chloroflexota bacterium]
MSGKTILRIFVWLISMALGFALAALMVVVGLPAIKPESAGITIAEFGTLYYLFVAVPLGLVFLVWIDLLADTGILPD